jgi:hypothetical protein
MIKIYSGLHVRVKYLLLLSDINETCNFSTDFPKKSISDFTNIRPVGTELFRADGQTDITKLSVVFRNFANLPKAPSVNVV